MPRPAWRSLAVGAAAGVALALLVTLLQPDVYRATATIVLTRPGAAPVDDPGLAAAAQAAATLIASGVVAESAVRNLRTGETAQGLLDRTRVSANPRRARLDIAVEGGDPAATRREAQELAEVFSVLYNERFGARARASLWDPPEAVPPRISPRPVVNLALGLLLGAIAGAAFRWRRVLPLYRRTRPRAPAAASVPPAPVVIEAEPEPEREPEPLPEPEPELTPAPEVAFLLPERGSWTIGDVERLLTEQGPAFPDRLAELRVYADTMRDVAAPDGRLPAGVEVVVEDVFADLIARAR